MLIRNKMPICDKMFSPYQTETMEATNSGNFLTQPSFGSQIVLAILSLFILFIILLSVETFYRYYLALSNSKIRLYPFTTSATKAITIAQDPSDPKSKTAFPSENQVTGIEFSYTCFLYVQDSTFVGDANSTQLKSVFHKGYRKPWPLCGPGVFVLNTENTLRIVMNSYNKWYNKVDVKGIPVNKWFHLGIVCRNSKIDVYINGNLATTMLFEGSVPYQNYQPITLFSYENFRLNSTTANRKDLPENESFNVTGPINGYISNLCYYRYAIGYSELQGDLGAGPSKEFDSSSMDMPPYLIDSWWTNRSV